MGITGGPLEPVYVVPDEELTENGGVFRVEGGPAIPVYGIDIEDGIASRGITGGGANPVYIVNESQPDRPVLGGRPMPVGLVSRRSVIGRIATPVYVVNREEWPDSTPPPPPPSAFPDWQTNGDFAAEFLVALNALESDQTDDVATFGDLAGFSKWYSGVLAPNGYIYGIPFSSTTILKIDPADDSVSTFGDLSGTGKWAGGVLAPNGCIYGIPYGSTTILKIDPADDSVSTFGSLSGTSKWVGGVLASKNHPSGLLGCALAP